ncbi:hypothetical protein COCC4DRAFT_30332 [Bipolaris maydis ATCC 48331]|uniref:Uncharacterized protein n=2 Tax=Cochliobolus heterostrophus TaxID=5016 RepID=M2UDJ1_COCH5|nr:uncharacterized protein COCC4DRAFT_30332 [Bipolaris maydis ATCC 48331]EMD91746.1 hypothetical protein COCHEDRAFT_1021607 [Bipolaris maydis C5]ENI08495.1 hypothetical protein COCC4DRAFT_30332 [Bipolaris maydis ATCC 48331]
MTAVCQPSRATSYELPAFQLTRSHKRRTRRKNISMSTYTGARDPAPASGYQYTKERNHLES